jgi:hypothetical protein
MGGTLSTCCKPAIVRWQLSGRLDMQHQFELLRAFLHRALAGDIIYPLYLVYGVLTGQDVKVAGSNSKYLMLKDDGGWLTHVKEICLRLAFALMQLQAWDPEGPQIQDVVGPASPVAGDQDVRAEDEVVKQANLAVYSGTVFGLEKFPIEKKVKGVTLAIHCPRELSSSRWWVTDDVHPPALRSDVWLWPDENKSMYLNANLTFVWCFEILEGPKPELPKWLAPSVDTPSMRHKHTHC